LVGCAAVFAVCGGSAGASIAQTAPPAPAPPGAAPVYRHNPDAHRHVGFYFRTWLGIDYLTLSASDADQELSGAGGAAGFAFGGAVAENWILYGEVFDDLASDPELRSGGNTSTADGVTAGVFAFGVGMARYFEPANMYVSVTIARSKIRIELDGGPAAETDFGLGVSAMAGKEWWVSDNWGIGFAVQAYVGEMKDQGPSPDSWIARALAIAFSATYN
jgi:hypothetical protein